MPAITTLLAHEVFSELYLDNGDSLDLGPYSYHQLHLEKISDIDNFIAECESETSEFKVAGEHRISDWEQGWSGSGIVSKVDGAPEDDLPFYFKKNTHIRVGDHVYRDLGEYGEFVLLRNLQTMVFNNLKDNLLSHAQSIVEYGCGTGHNIRFLKDLMPGIDTWSGCDWAQSAVDRVVGQGIVGAEFARRVNYFDPETFWGPRIPFVAFTNASLEQAGSNYREFISFLVNTDTCIGGIHIEPIRELLGSTHLDKNAFEYCERRGYLTNFLGFLKSHPVHILKSHNYGLGSKYISGYQLLVWTR